MAIEAIFEKQTLNAVSNRSSAGPSDFLNDFKGTLQIDGYEGYAEIITKNSLIRAACMDHVRRRFEKALGYDIERATHALERDAKEMELSAEDKLSMR
jgi:transposase